VLRSVATARLRQLTNPSRPARPPAARCAPRSLRSLGAYFAGAGVTLLTAPSSRGSLRSPLDVPRRSLRSRLATARRSHARALTPFEPSPPKPFESTRIATATAPRPRAAPADWVTRRSHCVRAPALCPAAAPPDNRGTSGPAPSHPSRGVCRRLLAITLVAVGEHAPRWMINVAWSEWPPLAALATRGGQAFPPDDRPPSWRTERARRAGAVRGANGVSATLERTASEASREQGESLGGPYPSAASGERREPRASEDIPPSDRERAEGFRGGVVRSCRHARRRPRSRR
jgi:hypothetical protein